MRLAALSTVAADAAAASRRAAKIAHAVATSEERHARSVAITFEMRSCSVARRIARSFDTCASSAIAASRRVGVAGNARCCDGRASPGSSTLSLLRFEVKTWRELDAFEADEDDDAGEEENCTGAR